jgi:hypothetical protein
VERLRLDHDPGRQRRRDVLLELARRGQPQGLERLSHRLRTVGRGGGDRRREEQHARERGA